VDSSESFSEATLGSSTQAPPADTKPNKKVKARRGGALREIVETLILTAVIFLGVRVLVQNYKVEGFSMEPTLNDGQYLLINKIGLHFSQPQRGDIIVFEYPLDPSKNFVKRVIGIPGDTVAVQDQKTLLNGKVLPEPYIHTPEAGFYPATVVPPNNYFVMGDNRNNSSDSRSWGMLPTKDVIGEAWVSYWPPKSWGLVPDYKLPA
jgi:signal peptidase I